MTVSNPASLSSANAEFGGNGTLSALVRGGAYVASNASATISTTVSGLALSQFNGVTKPSAAVSASVSPGSAGGTYPNTNTSAGSGSVTVSASGGNGSFSYSWAIQAGSQSGTGSITINSPSSASTSFSISGQSVNSQTSATAVCTVTSGGQSTQVFVNLGWTRGTPP